MEKYGVVAFGFTCAPVSCSEREIAMGAQTLSQKFEAPIFTQICMPIIATSQSDRRRSDAPQSKSGQGCTVFRESGMVLFLHNEYGQAIEVPPSSLCARRLWQQGTPSGAKGP